jgi:hypothetical protein
MSSAGSALRLSFSGSQVASAGKASSSAMANTWIAMNSIMPLKMVESGHSGATCFR